MVDDDSSLLEKNDIIPSVSDSGPLADDLVVGELLQPFPTSDVKEVDFAKELVKKAFEDTSAVDFLKEQEAAEDFLVSKEGSLSEIIQGADSLDNHLPKEGASADFLRNDETELPPTPKVNQDALAASEAVSAILAASEEATLAAEATLPKEVLESLPLLPPVTPSNGTMGDAAAETVISTILPASSVVGEPATTIPDKVDAPEVKKILKFAIPAIGVWLCSPLLSLIDTSAVGLLSGTAQQAALNPAVAVTDYAALLIAFMYTGTTNLVAAAREKDRGVEGQPRSTKNLIAALRLSGFVGAGLGSILFVFARPLLRSIIGNDAISPEIFTAAMKYVRIRALGMPAAAIIGSSQAACLGMQDIKSPLYVLVAAAVVNFFGDMTFVGSTHPWIGGAAGAAWATVFSQFAAVAIFTHWLCHKPKRSPNPKVVNLTESITELMGKPSSKGKSRREQFRDDLRSFGKSRLSMTDALTRRVSSVTKKFAPKPTETAKPDKKEKSFSTRGFLEGKFRGRDFFKPPTRESLSEFAPYVLPVTSTQVGRVSGYVAMSHVVSSSLGTVSMAAQQVIVSLFYCLCPIADSLSLTAQSFLPSIYEKRVSKARAVALRQTVRNFWKAGAVFGAGMVGAVLTIPIISTFFTSDPVVASLVSGVAPLLCAIFSVHGVLCASEGVLLGQKDLGFLGKAYAGYFVAVPYLMLRVKKAALSGANVGLTSVWSVFLSYQMFRVALWVARTVQLQRRTERDAAAAVFDETL